MMKTAPASHTLKASAFVAVVIAVLVSPTVGSDVNPLSPGSFGTELEECRTYSKISLVLTGGHCSGKATAECSVQATRLVEVQNIVKTFLQTTPCAAGKAQAAAKSVATALASVHASSLVSVTCTGHHSHGKGCGFGISNGQALAIAWTEAIAFAAAGALSDGKTAFCQSDISALVPVLASAFATSHTQLCASARGPVKLLAFQNSFQESVATAMADAFATASARVCGHLSETKCTGNAGTTGPSSSSTGGGVSGGVFTPGPSQGSSTGTAGGSAIGPFDTACTHMAACCGAVPYPCPCPSCRDYYVTFVKFDQLPSGPAKILQSGGEFCYCPLTAGRFDYPIS